jgi:hypothetical protein
METLELSKKTKSKLRQLHKINSVEIRKSILGNEKTFKNPIEIQASCSHCSSSCKGYCTSSCYGGIIAGH